MAEKITLEGQMACLTGETAGNHTIPLCRFAEGVAESTVRGLTSEPLPDNVKWFVECGKLRICIVELTPQVRWIKWLADKSPQPFGPEATYTEYRLATPYVVLKVPFWGRHIVPRVEAFYRNERLQSADDKGGELFWPNLYNVSVNAYDCTAWYCSQYLSVSRTPGPIQTGLDEIAHHLFGGGFNASSEAHEGQSTFSLCKQKKVDARVTDVHRWAEASEQDPRFVLGVKWKTTGLTVRELIDRELKFHNIAVAPQTAQALGNILLRKSKPK
jgi:hypothetical protein